MKKNEKNVVVLGGSSGIGLETSIILKKSGWKVIVGSRKNSGENLNYKKVNVNSEESITNFFNNIKVIDGLVYSVGIPSPKSNIINFSKQKWNNIIETNVSGALLSLKYAYPKLKASKGKIVIVNSIAARNYSIFSGIEYTMSKAALSGMVKHLSIDFAKDGVLINSVFPSMTSTKMLHQNVKKEKLDKIENKIPLRRIAYTQDIANTIKFLLSDENSYITGSGIDINGGQYLSS